MSKNILILKSICLLIFLLLFLIACNNRTQNNKKNNFKITLKARVLQDDKFQVFYVDEKNKGYSEDNRITTSVYKSQDFQEITFLLSTIPLKFRIDLGENRYESIVEIEKVILDNGNDKIELDNSALHRFFESNIYLKRVQKGYSRKALDNRYDPFLESTPLLEKKIELMDKTPNYIIDDIDDRVFVNGNKTIVF